MFRNLTVRARAVITCGATTAVTVFLVAEGVRRGADPGAMLAEGLTLVVLLSGMVWFFLAKPALGPLDRVAELADRLAAGDWPLEAGAVNQDEGGRAIHAVVRVGDMLRDFGAEMDRMSAEHDRGDIDVVIDVGRFSGGYRTMAQGVDEMVAGHIAVKKKAMAVVKAIGEGDFDVPLEQLPGKKAFINDTIETLRANLKGLVGEMDRMSAEHDRGDIDVVIDVGRFSGGYRTMAQGVNEMVAGHIAVKKKAMAVVKQFGEGNFEGPLEQFPGKKAFINDTIEQVRSNLKALIEDTSMLVTAAVEGRLQVRADAGRHAGGFRSIVQGVNDTLDAVIGPLTEVDRVLRAMQTGDLT